MNIEIAGVNNSEDAYTFALHNKNEITPEQLDFCRLICLDSPVYAYWYAVVVDESPREDTRQACLGSPEYAYKYARDVDGSPREDTRQTSLGDPEFAFLYARDVDKSYHNLTYEAVKSTEYQELYEDYFKERFKTIRGNE